MHPQPLSSRPRRVPAAPLRLGALLVAITVVSCRGRAEFQEGEALWAAGEHRAAYARFYEAWRLQPSTRHREAMEDAGALVAAGLLDEGRAEEAGLDWRAALDRYTLALEYHPSGASEREAYLRVRRTLDDGAALAASVAREDDPWRRALLRLELAAHPTCADPHRVELAVEAASDLRRWVRGLDPRSPLEPHPFAEPPLLASRATWQECEARVRWLRDVLSPQGAPEDLSELIGRPEGSWLDGASLALGRSRRADALAAADLERALARLLDEIDRSRVDVDEALRGLALFREGERLLDAGDALGAHRAFRLVIAHHPGATAALVAAESALEAWRAESRDAVRVSMARGEWGAAIPRLEALLRHRRDARELEELLARCQREVARENERAGAAFEARELPGNAFVRYLEARHSGEPEGEVDAALERVERALRERVRPDFELTFSTDDPGESLLKRELWRVDEGFVAALREIVARAFDLAGGSPGGRMLHAVVVEDLDFVLYERSVTRQLESERFVSGFHVSPNPEVRIARARVDRAREAWLRAKTDHETAPEWLRRRQSDLLELARGELEQARLRQEALADEVPHVDWSRREVPVAHVVLVAELAARVRVDRLDLVDTWVTVRWEADDRVVDDSSVPGLLPDPLEIPSREDVLEELASRLGRALRQQVERRAERAVARYYDSARRHLDSGSLELAIEDLATYVYALSGAPPTFRFEEAVALLEQLTESRALSAWVAGDS